MARMRRLFTGAISAETNVFSPLPTDLDSFRSHLWIPAGEGDPTLAAPVPIEGFSIAARALGWQLVTGLCAAASPGGPLSAEDFAVIRDELLEDLRNALPVDAVALHLHGGMIAAGTPDCEGDILARVRAIVGQEVPVGAILDPHAHLSDAMVSNAEMLIFFKEYPHTDIGGCAEQLVGLLAQCSDRSISPVASVRDCRMIDFYFTDREPMRSFVDDMSAREDLPKVLSVSLVHGFPWGDVPDMGTRMIVYTDGDVRLGNEIAGDFARRLFALRGTTLPKLLNVEEAVSLARGWTGAPLVLGDVADNPGGGAPGDATWLIGALVEAGIGGVLAGPLWDPHLVRQSAALGEGGEAIVRIGGKASSFSGPPLDLAVEVLAVRRNAVQRADDWDWPMGDAVLLRAGGLTIVATELRTQGLDPSLFNCLGVDPAEARIVVVKSAQHFVAGFEKLAGRIAYVATPGVLSLSTDPGRYQHMTRPKWPFDADPFAPSADAKLQTVELTD